MNKFEIGFIGSGKMATAIASALVQKKNVVSSQILASDISEKSLADFKSNCGGEIGQDNQRVIDMCPIVVLAVKPQIAEEVCKKLNVPQNCHIISICAGIKIASLSEWLKTSKITRVMPNTPLMVGLGASAYCIGNGVTESERAMVEKIFGSAGLVHQVNETDIDAVTGVSGSGPAYVFEFIQALADAGNAQGLSASVSLDLAVQTVIGAAQMVAKKLGTPDQLRDAVTSPNGTTFAALQVLKKEQFRDLIHSAVDAAVKRSIELGSSKK